MTEEYDDDPGYFFPEDREDEFPEKKDGAELEPWQIT